MDDIENKKFLKELLEAMYEELPTPKKKSNTPEGLIKPVDTGTGCRVE